MMAQHNLVRLYDNGDASGRTVKFVFPKKQAEALGIEPGNEYILQERLGQLELVPVNIKTAIAGIRGRA